MRVASVDSEAKVDAIHGRTVTDSLDVGAPGGFLVEVGT